MWYSTGECLKGRYNNVLWLTDMQLDGGGGGGFVYLKCTYSLNFSISKYF